MQGKHAKIVSPIQERAMLGYLVTTCYPARDRVLFLLSMKAGLRAKDMASLTWAMVTDAQGQVADVLHVSSRASKGKTGGRTMPLHPDLQAALVTWQTGCGDMATPERSILFSERGGGLSPAPVRLWCPRLSTSLKMDGCSSHAGRRTFMTRAARTVSQVGGSLRDVQERAGHTSLVMTQRSIEGDTEAQRTLVTLLEDECIMARRVEKRTIIQTSDTRASAGSGCHGWVAGHLGEPRGLRTRLLLPHVTEAWDKAKRRWQVHGARHTRRVTVRKTPAFWFLTLSGHFSPGATSLYSRPSVRAVTCGRLCAKQVQQASSCFSTAY